MKHFYILFLISIFHNTGFAQDDILFESTLYFEDAIGNKDSIVYGFAENEEISIINPIYGEAEINTPFDSIFEVRASHEGALNIGFTKKLITHVFDAFYDSVNNCYHNATDAYFVIHAKHYPVKISWDPQDYKNRHCIEGSMIIGHSQPFLFDSWFLEEDFLTEATCLATDSVLYRLENDLPYDFYNNIDIDVEGNKTAKGKGLFILFRDDYHFGGMCKAEGTNSVYNYASLPSLSPFPNPVNEVFHFGIEQARDYEIIDLHGRIVLWGKHKEAEVQFLSSGIYYLKVEGYAPQRFIKM